MFGPLSGWELLAILLIATLLFGAKRIPELARGLGEGIRNFRSSLKGDETEGGGDEGGEGSKSSDQKNGRA